MAILKDLIVHGSSRFLNKIYASEIQTPLIEADAGVFKKLKADDATIVGLLDVQGQMHTNSWTNSNIATIDGSFYITPTLSSSSGTVSFSSATAATFTGTYSAVSSLYVGNNTASTVQWTSGSKILITGEVQVNGEWIPLGTLLGTLNSTNPTTSMPVVGITDNRNNSSAILADIYSLKSNTSLSYRNLKVSLYQRADNSEYYPLGIFMTALGQNGKTFLDIYGGVNALTTSYGGYADPNVRIGNLSGLPAITTAAGNFTPVGWGIYTTNGYFSGTIVSNTGVIGGWKLGASSLYNGTTGLNNTTAGIYLGTDGIRNYEDANTYVNITEGVITAKGVDLTGEITATSGIIGGWNIGTDTNKSLYYGNQTPGATTTNLILSPTSATNSNAIGGSGTGLTWFISAGKVFGVTTAGALYATSGKIGGWSIGTSGIYNGITGITTTGSTAGTFIGTGGISNYKDTSTYVNIQNGVITAKGVNLTGQITATSGTIGGASIVNGTLTVPAANVSGELTAATINGSKITANTITASQIATNAITADELATNAVTSIKIKAGEVKADNIAANAVTAGKISVDNLSAITANLGTITTGVIKHDTVGGTDGIWLSADLDTSSNIIVGESTARKDWRLLVNDKFGVTKTGDLYASSANISGKITATSGTIGGIQLDTNGKMWITDANISGTISGNHIDASSISIGSLDGASNYAQKIDLEKVGEIVTYYLLSEKSEGVSFKEDTGWTLTPGIVTEEKKYLWAYQITKYGTNDENYEITEKAKIVSFYNEKQPIPLKNLVIDIDPVQSGSGDPSPSNIRPITGFDIVKVTKTGKNLFTGFSNSTDTLSSGITVVFSNGMHVNISGTTNSANADTSVKGNGGTARHRIIFEKGKTYIASLSGTFSLTGSGDSVRLMLQNDGGVVWHAVSTTGVWEIIPEEDFIVDRLCFRIPTKGTVVNIDADFQIEVGPEATEFESYNGNIYEVSLSQAGTVYGGTFNVLTGKLIIDRYVEDLSQKTWTTRYTGTLHKTLSTSLNNTYPRAEAQEKIIAEYYTVRPISGAAKLETPDDDEIGVYWYDNNANLTPSTLYIVIDINTTPSGSIVYPLVEPIEYQLTPLEVRSLTKANNIWADTGEVEVTYSTNAIKTEPYIVGTYDNTEIINNISTTANKALNQSSWYATCPTPGGTTEKVATITPATTAFTLTEGATVNVKFDAKNTGAVGSITLNVNGTGAKNIKYINNNTISNIPGTDYIAAGRTYQFVYDGTYWVIQNLNYNTNTNTIGTLGAVKLKAGTNASNASATTVYRYTLIMKKTIGDSPTWVSLVTSSSNGTSKTRYTGGLYPDEVFYMSSNVSSSPYGYNTGASTGDSYTALGFDLRYSTNCGSTLVIGKPVYLVGEISSLDGLFYLDSTWWTQTEPTMEDGKTYIYLGNAYSATNVYLVEKNPLMRYYRGAFRTEEQIAGMTATSYITYIDANNGIQVHNYNNVTDYIQINSDAISMYRGYEGDLGLNSKETLRIEDENIRVGKLGANERNLFITANDVQIRNNTTILAKYGVETVFYRPGTNVQALKIDSSNIFVGPESAPHLKLDATSLSAFHDADNVYFTLGNGSSTIEKEYTVEEPSSIFNVTNSIDQITSVVYVVNSTNTTVTNYEFNEGDTAVNIHHKIVGGNTIKITYKYSDTQNDGTTTTVTETFTVPDITLSITLSTSAVTVNSVKVDDTTVVNYTVSSDNTSISFVNANIPNEGQIITINYTLANTSLSPYFIFGNRNANTSFGSGSVSFGRGSSITGELGLASGWNHNISGAGSVSFGSTNTITGYDSFSVGYLNEVKGQLSAAMGYHSTAEGAYSFAMGHYAKTTQNCSFACGKYNNPNGYLFSVGMGTASGVKNAFGVDTNGNILIHGRINAKKNGNTSIPLFYTKRFTVDNIVVPATGGSTAATSDFQQINIGVTGYVAIGLMSFLSQTATNNGANASCVFPYVWWINQGYFRFRLRNTVTSQVKTKITFRILYISASAVYSNYFPSNGEA